MKTKTLSLFLLGSLFASAGCAAHNVREGGQCKSDGDCFKPLACSAGVCVRERFSVGHKCEVDADCGGSSHCVDLRCQ